MRSRVAPFIASKLALACLVAAAGCELMPTGRTAPTNRDEAPNQTADSGAVTSDDAGMPEPDAGVTASPDAGAPSVDSDAGVEPTSDAGASSPAEDAGSTPSLDGGPAPAVCGNGVVEAAEACDDGSQNGVGACLVSCACRSGYRSEGGACLDIDECATDNGGCGDARYSACTNHVGVPQTCTSINLCATNNGGCGDARYFSCTTHVGAPQTCAGVDLCATSNGGCGSSAVFACSNNLGAPPSCEERPLITLHTDWLTGSVAGLDPGQKATITLGNDGYLASRVVAAGESYTFSGVPDGTYFLKIDLAGHTVPKAKRVVVEAALGASFALDLLTPPPPPGEPVAIDFSTEPLPSDVFSFHWEEDASRAGRNQTAYVNQPPVVQFLTESVPVPDLVSADRLAHDYNIILSDESKAWDQEHAYRLLETLKEIPQRLRVASGLQDLVPSKWVLTTANLAGDIVIQYGTDGHTVLVSDAAFTYATPRMVSLDGERGSFFSRRLHHALVRWVTREGSDDAAVEKILTERYGCTTHVSDYTALTAPTTGETAASFQAFHPNELVDLINLFEEMPQGYHAVTGLKYLLRRRDGVPHPIYPIAPAVAWALPTLFPNGSYIEFMESGFTADPDDAHRLILHEKSHFLWGYVFAPELKQAWCTLGGWYVDPTARSGWSTTKEVEFVSAYAHEKNPNEDMAESLAYYVLDPDALRSRSLPKYEFIRDRVMHGARYLATLPSNLTFQVLNLHPDYTYPGKIKSVDITVTGAPTADKVATIEIQLNTAQNVFAGASNGNLRLYSPIGTYLDVWLYPTTAEGTVLRGVVPISKYAKSGLWRPDQIVINDKVGNQRMEARATSAGACRWTTRSKT